MLTSNQPPRSDQGRRLLGPAVLRTRPLASLLSQVRARLGPGGYCRCSGNGVPRLACLRPAAWLKWWPSAAHLHLLKLKTLARGQASWGGRQEASSEAASSGRLARRRRDQCKGTSRGSHDASHDDQGQAGASLHRVLVSPLVQRGQAHAKASGKGCHSGATRPRPAERQDGGHRGAQDGVITSAFGSRRPTLVRITCTRCSPSKWPLLAPFPLNIWEEDQGLYK